MTTLFSEEQVQAPEQTVAAPPDTDAAVVAAGMPEPSPSLRNLAAAVEGVEAKGHAVNRPESQAKVRLVLRIRFREEVTSVAVPMVHRATRALSQIFLLMTAAAALAGFICWVVPR